MGSPLRCQWCGRGTREGIAPWEHHVRLFICFRCWETVDRFDLRTVDDFERAGVRLKRRPRRGGVPLDVVEEAR
jgi:hypothetical protein